MINSKTFIFGSFSKKAGDVGCTLFNSAFKFHGINALYKSFSIDNIEKAVKAARILNFKGFAISMPFKFDVLKHIDDCDSNVKKIGTANTIIAQNNKLKAYNTDYLAIKEYLKSNIKDEHIYILGDGGYARAVKYAASKLNKTFSTITRRNWKEIKMIRNSVIINCTPTDDWPKPATNIIIDAQTHTKTGRQLALMQASHQYTLYTGLVFPFHYDA